MNIIEATNLPTRDPKEADPYCIVRFGKNEKKTKAAKHLCSPQWNEEFKLPIELGLIASTRLEIIIQDKVTAVKKNKFFKLVFSEFNFQTKKEKKFSFGKNIY